MFAALGRAVVHHPWRVIVVWLIAPWYLIVSVGLGFTATLGSTVLVFQRFDGQPGTQGPPWPRPASSSPPPSRP